MNKQDIIAENTRPASWVERLENELKELQESPGCIVNPLHTINIQGAREEPPSPLGGAELKRLIDEQLCALKGLNVNPNDLGEEYTGKYPKRADWKMVAEVLTDFHKAHMRKHSAERSITHV